MNAQAEMAVTSDSSGYRRMVKISLIHFLDPLIPGPHVSFEHRIAHQLFLRHEIGIPMNYNYKFQSSLAKLSGVRLRTGLRQYFDSSKHDNREYFGELALDYLYLNALGRENFRLGQLPGVFEQEFDYNITRRSFGICYILGVTSLLGKEQRLHIDIGFGPGMRLQHTEIENLANGLRFSPQKERPFFTLYDTDFWDYQPINAGKRIRFVVPMIWSLGYAF